MRNQISSKLAAFTLALMMNACMVGGVAYLFDCQTEQHSTVISHNLAAALEVA